MAGGQEKVLKRRVKSIQSTKKITHAMELIAATKVVKAQQRALAARPYAEQITEVIRHLSAAGAGKEHPLLRQAESVDKVAFVVITSDRGLAGAYNTSVIRAAERDLQGAQSEGADYSLVLIGKKAASYFSFRKYRIDAEFTGMSDTPGFEDAKEVAAVITDAFLDGDVDQVRLVYTRFLSAASQRVVVRRFMPLQAVAADEGDGDLTADYEYEPSPGEIFDRLLPRYVEARLFAAMLDAAASEHAARQRAMKSATDNAEELETNLSRAMNRARQDSITSEIVEIAGGAEAMSNS
ncbi:MAG: F0F1 ATP synthase subunit gamma [Actinomycetota bacterium]|nr:F0F1 ATP synthase subunit gamma [Actinomycetota bacterium]